MTEDWEAELARNADRLRMMGMSDPQARDSHESAANNGIAGSAGAREARVDSEEWEQSGAWDPKLGGRENEERTRRDANREIGMSERLI
jgi:hypothetical protein